MRPGVRHFNQASLLRSELNGVGDEIIDINLVRTLGLLFGHGLLFAEVKKANRCKDFTRLVPYPNSGSGASDEIQFFRLI